MTPSNPDDGFHEIQLNGKQLVFLFMAATVVSVVIFLCGVLVGRGVRTERAALVDTQALGGESADAAVVPAPPPSVPSDPAATAGTAAEEPEFDRAETGREPDAIRPVPPKPAAAPVAVSPAESKPAAAQAWSPAPAAKPEPPKPGVAPKPPAGPAPRAGYAVQVAAMNGRGEAETRVKRLQAKGYSAYVETPGSGSTMYRVRVGPFKTKGDADEVANRLKKEERISPWVVSP